MICLNWTFEVFKPHDVDATLFILSSATQILSNLEAKADLAKGQKYFEGSMKFMNTLTEVLDSLTDRVKVNHRSDLILACVSLFQKSLCSRIRTLDLLIARRSVSLVHPTSFPQEFSDRDLRSANISQIWGILLLLVVMIISPLLVILAKNAISSIQFRWTLIENVTEQKNEVGVLVLALRPKQQNTLRVLCSQNKEFETIRTLHDIVLISQVLFEI